MSNRWQKLGAVVACFAILGAESIKADPTFETFEIRTIRPRYFNKQGRLELGIQTGMVTNQTFIYTYFLSGLLAYHFSEQWAVEVAAAYGDSQERQDKIDLKQDFNINTLIVRTIYKAFADVVWTAMYGKYQLTKGTLVYFDTFFLAGAGVSGVEYRFDQCFKSKATTTVSYPSAEVGLGQRFYLSKADALRWDLRDTVFNADTKDGACDSSASNDTVTQQELTVHVGYSHFF